MTRSRHVLLSNDDGIMAPGLRHLAEAFVSAGWRVTVAAPDQERSAASHSLTIKRPLVVRAGQWSGIPEGAPLCLLMVDGTPADCVKLALHSLCDTPPDIVVSGINNGWNVGTDVHYSGTVGAAREAALEGYAAIAVSVHNPCDDRFQNAARVAETFACRVMENPLPARTVLNINLPNCAPCDVLGIVEAPLTAIRYSDSFQRMEHATGRAAYWLEGEILEEGNTPRGDLDCLLSRYATVTALNWDLSMPGACGNLLQD